MPNNHLTDEDAVFIVNEFKKHFDNITFYSWLREPDYVKFLREVETKKVQLTFMD